MNRLVCGLTACMLCAFPATHAHHSHASLNPDDVRLYQGRVTRYSWRAPHVYIRVDVVKPDGSVQEYLVEALNPPAMSALGWGKDTFKPGDLITWEGPHDLDLDRGYAGIAWAETPDGRRLYAGASDYRATQKAQNEALAKIAVEPVTEIGSGNWARVSADGSPFPPIRAPQAGWPLTEAAAVRVANWSEDDNPINNCVYGGPPRSILSLSNFRWSRPDENTIIIDRDMWMRPRIIHLDHDAPRGEPSGYGHSIGWFEGAELHVYTDNFVDETWGMYTGIDSTAEKTLKERYWLSDGGMRLNVEFTVEDPGVLTAPHTATHQWKRVPDRELIKAECSVEMAWLYKTAGYSDDVAGSVGGAAAAAIGGGDEGMVEAKPGGEDEEVSYAMLLLMGVGLIGFAVYRAVLRK